MPTSDENEGVMYYMENGKKEDAAIHDTILAEGQAPSRDDIIERMMSHGLTREEAERLAPDA